MAQVLEISDDDLSVAASRPSLVDEVANGINAP
jgi:hypothetical protein